MAFQWRRLVFFDTSQAIPSTTHQYITQFNSTCSHTNEYSSGTTLIVAYGNSSGELGVLRYSKPEAGNAEGSDEHESWQWTQVKAFDSNVTHVHALPYNGGIVAVGSDAVKGITLKVYAVDISSQQLDTLILARSVPLFSSRFPSADVVTLTSTSGLEQVCVGLKDGRVLVVDNLNRQYGTATGANGAPTAQPYKQTIIANEEHHLVATHFIDSSTPATSRNSDGRAEDHALFVVTEQSVSSIFTRRAKRPRVVLDEDVQPATANAKSADRRSTAVQTALTTSGKLVVAYQHAVYFYDTDSKLESFGIAGNKLQIATLDNYLIIVSEQAVHDTDDAAERKDDPQAAKSAIKPHLLTFYDLKHKFIAYQQRISPVRHLLALPALNAVLLQYNDEQQAATLQLLVEKDLNAKLYLLFSKHLYSVALNIALHTPLTSAAVAASHAQRIIDIHLRYADYLYNIKSEYESAMQQYIYSIGWIDTSYVIEKYLDPQLLQHLITYLEAVHRYTAVRQPQHTVMLIQTYIKVNQTERLRQFVKSDLDGLHNSSSTTANFDVTAAITALRDVKYYDLAVHLAERYKHHDHYVRIQLHDLHDASAASKYIEQQSPAVQEKLLLEFAGELLQSSPTVTTDAIISVCSSRHKASPDQFIECYTTPNNPTKLDRELMRFLVAVQNQQHAGELVYHTLVELYLRLGQSHGSESMNGSDSTQSSPNGHGASAVPYNEQLMYVLKMQPPRYDTYTVLALCHTFQYTAGVLYLYERLQLYDLIMQQHIDNHDIQSVITTCHQHATNQPSLWISALQYFVKPDSSQLQAERLEQLSAAIDEVLHQIHSQSLLTPHTVIQMIAQSSSTQLSSVRNYLVAVEDERQQRSDEMSSEIERYQQDIAGVEEELKQLQTSDLKTTEQLLHDKTTKCNKCNQVIADQASTVFQCRHVYHNTCLSLATSDTDSDTSSTASVAIEHCPECYAEYERLIGIQQSMRHNASDHNAFFKQLDDSTDPFTVMTTYFAQGLFAKQPSMIQEGAG